jgi:hypothetical protein
MLLLLVCNPVHNAPVELSPPGPCVNECVCVSEKELTSSFVFMSERENSPPFRPFVQSHVRQSSSQ